MGMIEEYNFGFIKINGQTYNHDVQIGLDNKVKLWWRSKSHEIWKRDIEEVLDQVPEAIVIGTGEMGIAQLTEEARQEIISKKIELIVEPTAEAVKSFNSLKKDLSALPAQAGGGQGKKVVGLFHLTC